MDVIFLLIPITLGLAGLIIWALMWAVKSGQFDDLEGPAHQILMDDDKPLPAPPLKAKSMGEDGHSSPPE
jgi:cbb3-type cytochrome oxidase maturation protein